MGRKPWGTGPVKRRTPKMKKTKTALFQRLTGIRLGNVTFELHIMA